MFILVDDLGYMDVGADSSSSFYETSNIDRIDADGIRFTQGYATAPVYTVLRGQV